jgi:hypothetical protein
VVFFFLFLENFVLPEIKIQRGIRGRGLKSGSQFPQKLVRVPIVGRKTVKFNLAQIAYVRQIKLDSQPYADWDVFFSVWNLPWEPAERGFILTARVKCSVEQNWGTSHAWVRNDDAWRLCLPRGVASD